MVRRIFFGYLEVSPKDNHGRPINSRDAIDRYIGIAISIKAAKVVTLGSTVTTPLLGIPAGAITGAVGLSLIVTGIVNIAAASASIGAVSGSLGQYEKDRKAHREDLLKVFNDMEKHDTYPIRMLPSIKEYWIKVDPREYINPTDNVVEYYMCTAFGTLAIPDLRNTEVTDEIVFDGRRHSYGKLVGLFRNNRKLSQKQKEMVQLLQHNLKNYPIVGYWEPKDPKIDKNEVEMGWGHNGIMEVIGEEVVKDTDTQITQASMFLKVKIKDSHGEIKKGDIEYITIAFIPDKDLTKKAHKIKIKTKEKNKAWKEIE
jgi:hypothetical protein